MAFIYEANEVYGFATIEPFERRLNNHRRKIKVQKLTLNVSIVEIGDRLTRAHKLLEQLNGQNPIFFMVMYNVQFFEIIHNKKLHAMSLLGVTR